MYPLYFVGGLEALPGKKKRLPPKLASTYSVKRYYKDWENYQLPVNLTVTQPESIAYGIYGD